jgi:hypothetical protein
MYVQVIPRSVLFCCFEGMPYLLVMVPASFVNNSLLRIKYS